MADDTQQRRWDKVDQPVSGLKTDADHEVQVQREAIPLVFIPGIMGSRLRLSGTDGQGKGSDGLPNLRWDPGSSWYMFNTYSGTSGPFRKSMLIGQTFNSSFLEVDNTNPMGDGFHGIMEDYWSKFLNKLKAQDWGAVGKIFEFPVYALGYNWTDTNKNSGTKLAARIQEIIQEAKKVTGICEKVIVITHSMGGLVARWASQKAGAQGSILGVIHGVQPATGATAAYWRMKAGFEGLGPTSRVLGHSAREVTPVLGNMPGGLELLPNKLYRTNSGSPSWLTITGPGSPGNRPQSGNPYSEIYRQRAVVRPKAGEQPSTNEYWGLVDPDLLDPGQTNTQSPGHPANSHDALDADHPPGRDPWDQYMRMLSIAESFHDQLQNQAHSQTYTFRGIGHTTSDVVELAIQSNWVRSEPYPERGFRGFFTNASGSSMQAVLQDPAGDGDGTVAKSSAASTTLAPAGKPVPGQPNPADFKVEHQPAYEDSKAQAFTVKAIIALSKMRYEAVR